MVQIEKEEDKSFYNEIQCEGDHQQNVFSRAIELLENKRPSAGVGRSLVTHTAAVSGFAL